MLVSSGVKSIINAELVASGLIVWLTVALHLSAEKVFFRFVLVCGLWFGLLALTKAAVAYTAILALPCTAYLLSCSSRQFWGNFNPFYGLFHFCVSMGLTESVGIRFSSDCSRARRCFVDSICRTPVSSFKFLLPLILNYRLICSYGLSSL